MRGEIRGGCPPISSSIRRGRIPSSGFPSLIYVN